jgi:hypothetical protein
MLLAAAKLEDDVRDDQSWAARILLRWLAPSVERSRDVLELLQPGAAETLKQLVAEHVEGEESRAFRDVPHFAEATAAAFRLLFNLFGKLCSRRLDCPIELGQLGEAIGNGLIAADCIIDWERDRRRAVYNPIRNGQEFSTARDFALQSLTMARCVCEELIDQSPRTVGQRRAMTPHILADVLHRVSVRSSASLADDDRDQARLHGGRPVRRVSILQGNRAKQKQLYPLGFASLVRRGDCDCFCDGCGACDVPDAGCMGGVDESCGEGTHCCFDCGDCCWWNGKRRRDKQ